MIGFDEDFERQCGEYLDYLYGLAEHLYSDAMNNFAGTDLLESEMTLLQREEYEPVRREIGRLISLYREVVVRHYVHGQSVEQIAEVSPEKQRYPILLVNPVPVEILQQFNNGKEVILNPGTRYGT